jgi:hypothetical protein
VFKGFIEGTRSRIRSMISGKAVSIKEKCRLSKALHEFDLILRDCDMQSALYIKEAK